MGPYTWPHWRGVSNGLFATRVLVKVGTDRRQNQSVNLLPAPSKSHPFHFFHTHGKCEVLK